VNDWLQKLCLELGNRLQDVGLPLRNLRLWLVSRYSFFKGKLSRGHWRE
jgi:hypothetical protein